MAESNRDDFSPQTKKALGFRAGHRCSFPNCRASTSGPSNESPTSYINIGVAAHIHAASPGRGARRYLASMTAEQRKDISNGIWLCRDHSVIVDADEALYTAELLRKMKADHEMRVSIELGGVRPASATDFIALGAGIVFAGEIVGVCAEEWHVRVDSFLLGDLSELMNFSEHFERLALHERYVLVNALGDGRRLAAAPVWRKKEGCYVVGLSVLESFPRTSVHALPKDLALDATNDLFLSGGDFATVEGITALPQKIKTSLSTLRGELLYDPTFGSRIREYFDLFSGSTWLMRLIKLEVIRLACIPYYDAATGSTYTPLQSVLRVHSVTALPPAAGLDWLPFHFELELQDFGRWACDISVFIPSGQSLNRPA